MEFNDADGDGSGAATLTTRYVHGPQFDQVLASETVSGNVVTWTLTDHQGTVRDMIRYASGTTTIVNHRKFDAFGNLTAESDPTVKFLHSYTGREWDADAGLMYYRARWYDPTLGRFISEDPIGFQAGDTSLSRYVGNSMPNAVDPTGFDSKDLQNDFTRRLSIEFGVAGGHPAIVESQIPEHYQGHTELSKVFLEQFDPQSRHWLNLIEMAKLNRDMHTYNRMSRLHEKLVSPYEGDSVAAAGLHGTMQGIFMLSDPFETRAEIVARNGSTEYMIAGNAAIVANVAMVAADVAALRQAAIASTRQGLLHTPSFGNGRVSPVVNGAGNRPITTINELLLSTTMPGQSGVILNQRTVYFDDVWKLSVRDGAEYLLTPEHGQKVLRSGLSDTVSIPVGVRPIAHTHPPDIAGFVDKLPSTADINVLNSIWEITPNGPRPVSQIITGPGETTIFKATGTDTIPMPKGR